MNEYKTGYDNGWADCTTNRRENERTLLEAACMERGLSLDGSARDLLSRIICWEIAWAIRQVHTPLPSTDGYDMTIAQRR